VFRIDLHCSTPGKREMRASEAVRLGGDVMGMPSDSIPYHTPCEHREPSRAVSGNPHEFTERTHSYMTFNTGPHRCVGLNLARLEMKVLYSQVTNAIPPTFSVRVIEPSDDAASRGVGLAVGAGVLSSELRDRLLRDRREEVHQGAVRIAEQQRPVAPRHGGGLLHQ